MKLLILLSIMLCFLMSSSLLAQTDNKAVGIRLSTNIVDDSIRIAQVQILRYLLEKHGVSQLEEAQLNSIINQKPRSWLASKLKDSTDFVAKANGQYLIYLDTALDSSLEIRIIDLQKEQVAYLLKEKLDKESLLIYYHRVVIPIFEQLGIPINQQIEEEEISANTAFIRAKAYFLDYLKKDDIEYLNKAIQADPNYKKACYLRGLLTYEKNRKVFDEILSSYDKISGASSATISDELIQDIRQIKGDFNRVEKMFGAKEYHYAANVWLMDKGYRQARYYIIQALKLDADNKEYQSTLKIIRANIKPCIILCKCWVGRPLRFVGTPFGRDRFKARHHIGIMLGSSHYIGDLSFNHEHYISGADIENSSFAVGISFNKTLGVLSSIRAEFVFLQLKGGDQVYQDENFNPEVYRTENTWQKAYRNLNFNTYVYDFSVVKELALYNFSMRSYSGPITLSPYVFVGVGGFVFDPRTQYNGRNVRLGPLMTEGQGFGNNIPAYKKLHLNIPTGFGIRLTTGRRHRHKLVFDFEFNYRFTFTDYIDDVSAVYTNPNLFDVYLEPEQAALAKILHQRSDELDPQGFNAKETCIGCQRGDSTTKDRYFMVVFRMSRSLDYRRRRFVTPFF